MGRSHSEFSAGLRSLALATVACLLTMASAGIAATSTSAGALLSKGQADQALVALQQTLRSNADDARALNLECRVYFAEERMDAAEAPCAQAVALSPNDSDFHLWLGRVLGREAEHAPMLSAYGLAKKTRAQFELAYQLDPHSAAAAGDLAEFYIDAPRILGGGEAKAKAISDAIAALHPSLSHEILAEIAANDKNAAVAEQQLRAAATSPDAKPEAWVALAAFYRKQGQIPAMLSALDTAIAMDTAHDDALVSAAEQLTLSHQRPQQAIRLLRSYLASSDPSEDAPAFQVRAQLAQLLSASGDAASAQQQLTLAHALASGWRPATGNGS